jgi:hypothetical protein
MIASFASAGFVALVPALAAMLGANVGTTLIVQVLSFDVSRASPLLLLGGVVLALAARAKIPVVVADIGTSPIALEAVKRIDAIFDIEREINGLSAEERLAARRSRCAPLVAALEEWTRSERAKLSRHNAVAKGHRLYAHPLAGLLPLPRRRTYLSYEQRGGTSAARPGLGPKIMALRRLRARG